MINVITSVFNNFSVAHQSITSILKNTNIPFKLILIDNHSFDAETRAYLQRLSKRFQNNSSVQIIDPGRNLGCHNGWNLGFDSIDRSFEFCCKIDDDVIVPENWASILVSAFQSWNKHSSEKLAILAADLDCRTRVESKFMELAGFKYEETSVPVSFSCVLFEVATINHYGKMKGYGLYGHEESYYHNLFRNNGLKVLWLKDVLVHHISSKEKNWDYIVWKYFYGFRKKTKQDFDSFVNSLDFQKAWFSLITYYLSTDRSKLRKDEDPETATLEFLKRSVEYGWILPPQITDLLKSRPF